MMAAAGNRPQAGLRLHSPLAQFSKSKSQKEFLLRGREIARKMIREPMMFFT